MRHPVTFINQPVLLGDSPGRRAGQCKLERFRLSDSGKRISQNSLHQLQYSKCGVSIRLYPVLKVLAELRVKNGFALSGAAQAPNPAVVCRAIRAYPFVYSLVRAP